MRTTPIYHSRRTRAGDRCAASNLHSGHGTRRARAGRYTTRWPVKGDPRRAARQLNAKTLAYRTCRARPFYIARTNLIGS